MAVLLYVGKPRSGKSYRVVYDLLEKRVQDRFYILHNIDGLKVSSFDYPERICDWRDLVVNEDYENFFSIENQQKICEEVTERFGKNSEGQPNVNVLIVVDEAHMYGFDRNNKTIRSWVAYHGHFGQEIWLVSQRAVLVNASYRAFSEFTTIAMSNAMLNWVPGYFHYCVESAGGTKVGSKWIRKKQEVFDAYQSFQFGGVRKHTSYKLPLVAGASLFGLLLFFVLAPKIFKDEVPETVSEAHASVDGSKEKKVSAISEKKGVLAPAGNLGFHEDSLKYRFAAAIGEKIYLQRVDGGSMIPIEMALGPGRVVKVVSGNLIYAGSGGIYMLSKHAAVRRQSDQMETKTVK